MLDELLGQSDTVLEDVTSEALRPQVHPIGEVEVSVVLSAEAASREAHPGPGNILMQGAGLR